MNLFNGTVGSATLLFAYISHPTLCFIQNTNRVAAQRDGNHCTLLDGGGVFKAVSVHATEKLHAEIHVVEGIHGIRRHRCRAIAAAVAVAAAATVV